MNTATRPLLPGFYSDPTLCRSGEDYYLATSSFEYFPGVPIFHSRDLITWRQIGHVLTRDSQLPLQKAWVSDGIFAPTLRHHDGRFFLITTNITAPTAAGSKNFIVHAADPAGPWSDPLWIEGLRGIDPDLFWEADGTCYVQWSWHPPGEPVTGICIGQAAINPLAGRLLEAPRVLWRGSGGLGPEGPHLFHRDGWYYLCIAEGGTEYGHMQTIARSRSVRGPFEGCPRNPVLTHRSSASAVQAVGHADLVQTPDGEWWGVAHGIRPQGYHKFHVLGRETFLYPVSWDADGWPVFGEQGMLPERTLGPGGCEPMAEPLAFNDDFHAGVWPLAWNWLGNPERANYRRTGDGAITLVGAARALMITAQPTWVGIRQRAHTCRVGARVRLMLAADGAEAGLLVWQNQGAYCLVGARRREGVTRLFTRRLINSLVLEQEGAIITDVETVLELVIDAEPLCYRLGTLGAAGKMTELTRIEAKFLSTEITGRFTGVYFALHALGVASLECQHFEVS